MIQIETSIHLDLSQFAVRGFYFLSLNLVQDDWKIRHYIIFVLYCTMYTVLYSVIMQYKEYTFFLNSFLMTHSGEKPHICQKCYKRFTNSSDLKNNMRTHCWQKPYVCQQCDQSFTASGNQNVYIKKKNGEKPYDCKQCFKCVNQSGNLERQMSTHSGEKPYL